MEKDNLIIINEERIKDLEIFYKYTYVCDGCHLRYGSDKEEKGKHLCPFCNGEIKIK